jgi:hypothetical protein
VFHGLKISTTNAKKRLLTTANVLMLLFKQFIMNRNKNRKVIRDRNQVHDTQGEAQNVNDGRRAGVTDHDRNKATEGIRQGRDESSRAINRNERSNTSMKRE